MGLGATADGLAEGEGLGEGLGVGLATSDDNGLGFTAVPAEPQPVRANNTARPNTPRLIRDWNAAHGRSVTPSCTAHTIALV